MPHPPSSKPSRTIETIRTAYLHACRSEIDALKPGNVHRYGDGHGMQAAQFLLSADVTVGCIATAGASVGQRVLCAVEATRVAVATNTNLGILLLCAPLALAAERDESDLREAVTAVLQALDHKDAERAFRAIVVASPGGLGRPAANDVHGPAEITLLEAMRQASERDRIAYQYVNAYEDVFGTGLDALNRSRAAGLRGMWPTVRLYMSLLAQFPDTHIVRKAGPDMAEAVRAQAATLDGELWTRSVPERIEMLLDFDAALKDRGLNPGTSADLTVATLMADALRAGAP